MKFHWAADVKIKVLQLHPRRQQAKIPKISLSVDECKRQINAKTAVKDTRLQASQHASSCLLNLKSLKFCTSEKIKPPVFLQAMKYTLYGLIVVAQYSVSWVHVVSHRINSVKVLILRYSTVMTGSSSKPVTLSKALWFSGGKKSPKIPDIKILSIERCKLR